MPPPWVERKIIAAMSSMRISYKEAASVVGKRGALKRAAANKPTVSVITKKQQTSPQQLVLCFF